MCTPATAAQGGLMVLGTALELQDNQVAFYQEQINARNNERISREAAADSIVRGNREAALIRSAATQAIAHQQVAFSASGIDATVGTPAALAGSTAAITELDALTAKSNALREAYGHRSQAEQIRRQSKVNEQRYMGRQFATVLGGTSRLAELGGKPGGY